MEEYKKPEYQVTVNATPRVLEGNSITAIIQARYFFGEPVSGAKVKYVVHTSEHWWWDEDQEDESSGDSATLTRTRSSPTKTPNGARTSSRNTRVCSMQTVASPCRSPRAWTPSITIRIIALRRA